MADFDDVLRALRGDRRTLNELERLSGIPAETLRDLKNRTTSDPRLSTIKALLKLYPREAA